MAGRHTQEAQIRGNDVADRVAPALDLRSLLEKPGAEHALDGAQITAGLARQIAFERLVAECRRIVIQAEEQRGRYRRRAALDRQQASPCPVADANGRIRRAEIDAARPCHALLLQMRSRALAQDFAPGKLSPTNDDG